MQRGNKRRTLVEQTLRLIEADEIYAEAAREQGIQRFQGLAASGGSWEQAAPRPDRGASPRKSSKA